MRNKLIGWAAIVALLLVAAYVGSPYLAVRNFKIAALSADVDKLDATVDFPAVRESLKSQLSAAMMREMTESPEMKDNPFAGLGAMMMPAIIDKAVDAFVTPDGLSALARGSRPQESPKPANIDVDYDYEYINMDRFRVKVSNKDASQGSAGLVFERRGLFTWKLIRIEIPPEIFNKPVPASATTPPVKVQPGTVFPPPTAPAADMAVDQLKAEWEAQNEKCRGGSHDPEDAVSKARDATATALEAKGWCWAYSDVNVYPADYRWHPCAESRPVDG